MLNFPKSADEDMEKLGVTTRLGRNGAFRGSARLVAPPAAATGDDVYASQYTL